MTDDNGDYHPESAIKWVVLAAVLVLISFGIVVWVVFF